jgi:hypothetical protein
MKQMVAHSYNGLLTTIEKNDINLHEQTWKCHFICVCVCVCVCVCLNGGAGDQTQGLILPTPIAYS